MIKLLSMLTRHFLGENTEAGSRLVGECRGEKRGCACVCVKGNDSQVALTDSCV